MTPLAFAWRSLSRQPARAALGIVGIAVVGALLFDMLLLSRGLLISFRDLLDDTGFDVRVAATEAPPGSGPRLENASAIAAVVRTLPEVAAVVPVCLGSAVTADAGEPVYLSGEGPGPHRAWTLIRGQGLPDSDEGRDSPPVVVNATLAGRLGLAPGDPFILRAGDGSPTALPAVRFTVVGVAEFPFDSAGAMTAATTLPAWFRLHGEREADVADLLLVGSARSSGPAATVEAIRHRYPGLNVYSNEQLVARFQRAQFSYFRQISFALSTITLFFAFLLVTTLLTVSVNQRFAEIASLRALGFTRRRVVADLLWESALMVGTGGLLALPAGWLLAARLDAILRGMPALPERLHFFVFEPRAVIFHAALLAIAGLLAALYPVYLAARLPIAATLRKETVS